MKAGGHFQKKRREQARYWMHQTIEHRLKQDFFDSEAVQARMEDLEAQVLNGTLTSFVAAEELLDAYRLGRDADEDPSDR
jgi:LAO/AO transport system kinase